MPARNRLPPWHEHIRLANGREVLIRPIRADDAGPLHAAFALLQPEEIRQRFLHGSREAEAATLQRLAQPNPRGEFTLVAAEPLPPGEALVGAMARATIVPGTRDAEFAILVGRHVAGLGLGRHLLRRLVRWARGRPLDRLHGDVPDGDAPMLALAQSLGFLREPSDSPALARVALDLRPTARAG